jgi:hypothetical protein
MTGQLLVAAPVSGALRNHPLGENGKKLKPSQPKGRGYISN